MENIIDWTWLYCAELTATTTFDEDKGISIISTSYASYQNTNRFGKLKNKKKSKGNRLRRKCLNSIIEY